MARTQRKKTTSKRSSSRRTTRRSKKRSPKFLGMNRSQWAIIFGITLIALSVIAILGGLSISKGQVTERMWEIIWVTFGLAGVAVPILIGALGLFLVLWGMDQPPGVPWSKLVGLFMLFLGIESALHNIYLMRNPTLSATTDTALRRGGGYVGAVLNSLLESAAGSVGALVLAIALSVGGLFVLTGWSLVKWLQRPDQRKARVRRAAIKPSTKPARKPVRSKPEIRSQAKPATTKKPPKKEPKPETTPTPMKSSEPGLFYGDAVLMASAGYSWKLPIMEEILDESSEARAADARIREQVDIIEQTLASFGAPSRVVEVNPGPVITQYGVEPQYIQQRNGRRVKVKVGRITSLADDLALALAARSIRIEAPVPGKGYVGIEVPNSEPTNVNLRDVMESDAFESIDSALRIALGHNVSGSSVAVDLTHMPHLLIAGTTGSGKSVCINSLATCLLLNNTPDQLRFLMVDPKRVELTGYNGIPHLLTPVIVDLNKVVGTLQWVLREMDSRYLKFAEAGARNIADYNQHLTSNGNKKLPYIVVIIDELADLMLMAPEDTERTVCRLAQMARATGIHLIIATQRPSVDVVTGLIKANFPARIAFAVTSSTDSRVILDTTGAERLLGRGDMLLMAPDSAQPSRMQGCNVAEHELRRLVEFWRRQRLDAVEAGKQERAAKKDDEPEKEPPKQQPLWEEIIELEEQEQAKDQDELYDQAVETVRSIGKASVSLLQRRLRIGYTRAARLIDEMEERGIVGPHPGGSRQRQVLPATDDVEPEPE